MDYTIHLTEKCNLRCKYCYEEKKNVEISFDNIRYLLDFAIKDKCKKSTITFFGGEPLIKKNLIYQTIEYAERLEKENDFKFYYQMNTNGTLLDEEFIKYAKEKFITISYSIDGNQYVHDLNRRTLKNEGSFEIVQDNAKKLLQSQPYSIAMLVITLNNLEYVAESVEYIFKIGFKYIVCALDYTCKWNDEQIEKLRREFEKIAEIYYEKTMKEDSFYLEPFENKINMHISKKKRCLEMCQLGLKHVNIGANGKIYPCMQFVGMDEYEIGDCQKGIDFDKQQALMRKSCKEYEICTQCAVRERCKHTCGCLNLITSGNINQPSPLICETEKMLIEISDKLAEKLYKKKSRAFIQKKYNKIYPLIEMFER